jgi:NDP-sugar pyrophosphorylase family protein
MRAVILAGGLGTRLRPYTTILPKPLIPVGSRPVIEVILHQLAGAGVRRVDMCVGHLGELIRAYLEEGATLDERLELAWRWEAEPLGTAGALRLVPDLDESFLALNGDVLTTLDHRELMAFHSERRAALTIAMRTRRVDIELGVIEHSDEQVTGYREKPSIDYDASMGVYAYEPRALELLPEGPCQFPELVLRLLEAGEHVAAFRSDAEWYDIGTFAEYERAVRWLEAQPEVSDGGAGDVNPATGAGRAGPPGRSRPQTRW